MSFLTINNYPVPVRAEEVEKSYEKGQNKQRAYNGELRSTTRFKKKAWEMQTTLLTADEADAIQALLEGEGHYFPFDSDLYSAKGLSPESGYSVTQSSNGGKYGGYIAINADSQIQYDFSYSYLDYSEYTVICWKGNTGTSAGGFLSASFPAFTTFSEQIDWDYYAFNSNGDKYYNGEKDENVLINFADMTNELLTLQDTTDAGDDQQPAFDELIVLPFVATDEMISNFYNLGEFFSSLPRLKLNGDISNNRQIIVECNVEDQPHQQFRNSEDWQNNGQRVSFTIQEV